ncbi:MAG: hypothetical protein KJP21_00725 [Bacteroidia bacterium]|nr:hypothetical protein [Bacteroidia bacterium]NNJ56492.1 hypothetical protein [Bacteroidia bacterium]
MILLVLPIIRFLLPQSVTAIALWPFVFFKNKEFSTNKVILNHEKIHLKQQIELLIIFFYIIYLVEYIVLLITHLNHDKAYRNISFEKEAYLKDKDLDYLKKRKFWSMWRKETT